MVFCQRKKNSGQSNEAKMATGFHMPLKVIEFNASDAGEQRYELNKQLQDQHVDVGTNLHIYLM
jgi:hypothetical protein